MAPHIPSIERTPKCIMNHARFIGGTEIKETYKTLWLDGKFSNKSKSNLKDREI